MNTEKQSQSPNQRTISSPRGRSQAVAFVDNRQPMQQKLISQRLNGANTALQRYRKGVVDGMYMQISEDGTMAAPLYNKHWIYATQYRLAESNSALQAANGGRLKLKSSSLYSSIAVNDKTLCPITMSVNTSLDREKMPSDCGDFCRLIILPDNRIPYSAMLSVKIIGVCASGSDPSIWKKKLVEELKSGYIFKYNPDGSLSMSKIIRGKGNRIPDETDLAIDKISKLMGINEYASPNVGEGYVISSGGSSKSLKGSWNFHWAGVVMKDSRGDNITLENFAVSLYNRYGKFLRNKRNDQWRFYMYGTQGCQTFHSKHIAENKYGDSPTTMVAK